MIILFTIIMIVGFIILYQIIKFKSTTYKYTEVVVLKNELRSTTIGSTDKPFNLIGEIPGLMGNKVYILKTDKFIFNKLVKTTFTVEQSNDYDDCDDDYW